MNALGTVLAALVALALGCTRSDPPASPPTPVPDPELVQSYRLPSVSMLPTLWPGDLLLVAKGRARGTAARGDLIVYLAREDRQAFVKRVVALGGDRVSWEGGRLHVNGSPLGGGAGEPADTAALDLVGDEGAPWRDQVEAARERLGDRSWLVFLPRREPLTRPPVPLVVPDGHAYVLGDNRDWSVDSRQQGPIPLADVQGRVVSVLTSFGGSGFPRWARTGVTP